MMHSSESSSSDKRKQRPLLFKKGITLDDLIKGLVTNLRISGGVAKIVSTWKPQLSTVHCHRDSCKKLINAQKLIAKLIISALSLTNEFADFIVRQFLSSFGKY